MAIIFESVQELAAHAASKNIKLVVTSGGFDPVHVGHLRCLQQSSELTRLAENSDYETFDSYRFAVIVNDDGFLMRKKGYAFMPVKERIEIIAGFSGVDYVTKWDDGTQTVVGAIDILKPFAFTKGGDRDEKKNVPEFDVCEKHGTKVIFGVGGGKIQSSSDLVAAINAKR